MPLHTLMFGWEYPPLHSGGLGIACQGLVKGLLRNGTRVTLVLPMNSLHQNGKNLSVRGPDHDMQEAPSICFVESALQPYDNTLEYETRMRETENLNGQSIAELYGPNLGAAVERFTEMSVTKTKDIHPDVIHCHDWMTFGAGARAAAYHRKPLVAHIHATELDRTDFHPDSWIADRERTGLLRADRIIAVSQYTKNILVRHYGIAADKVNVVHNGHNVSAPAAAHSTSLTSVLQKRAPLVLFVGRLTLQKNPRQFLESAKLVHELRPDAQFVMAGDGPMLPELMDLACSLGLTDCVSFTGTVTRKEVTQLYKAADCFVMPSLSEPFGLVALEAIANGTPVILSRQSGAAEVIEHGFKVDFWDTDKFADCILTILREEPLAQQLIAQAPSILHRLNWQNQAGNVMSIYRDLMKT